MTHFYVYFIFGCIACIKVASDAEIQNWANSFVSENLSWDQTRLWGVTHDFWLWSVEGMHNEGITALILGL